MKKFVKITAVALSAITLAGVSVPQVGSAEHKTVILGGQPFGVKFYNDGVMVVELEDFYDGGRYVCPAKSGGLKVGDIIRSVNGKAVQTNEDLQSMTVGSAGKAVTFTVERNGKTLTKEVTPEKNTAGMYLLGAWVRDSCAGIGTVTYYDAQQDYFAALGHGICDGDTGKLMPLGSAEIVKAEISSVTKSIAGSAGSLNGYFSEESLGYLTKNTPMGVYGKTDAIPTTDSKTVEVADFSEIKVGDAQLYTTVEEGEAAFYSIEITDICNGSSKSNENFVIKVTDDKLLEQCGGIVQGMSGSPILQNGKLIGAVTHVFLNSPKEGYGVSARYMVSNYED